MTIDEAITREREVAAMQRSNEKLNRTLWSASPYVNESCNKCAKEHDQLAEWLEELKAMRNLDKTNYSDGYNRAIDDFIKAVDKHCGYYSGECKNLTRDDLLEIAKELKDNG